MRWKQIAIALRLISLALGVGGFAATWWLVRLAQSGEDFPPPFMLLAGLAGIVFLFFGIVGRCPRLRQAK